MRELTRVAPTATVLLVVVLSVASGPLVAPIDFTAADERNAAGLGSGSLSATVLSVPEEDVRLERDRFGSEVYYLRVPDATVRLDRVEGQPLIVYKIRIPALGTTRGTTKFLNPDHSGNLTLSVSETSIEADRVDRDRYAGEILIVARTNDDEEVLYQSTVQVEVVR